MHWRQEVLVDKSSITMSLFGKRFRIFRNKGIPDIHHDSNFLMKMEPWTPTVAIDKSSPVTIRRNIGNKISKSVTFANYLYNIDDKQYMTLTESKSIPEIPEIIVTSVDGNETKSHTNHAFQSDETNLDACFLSAFGKKGKGLGEFSDAKDITVLSQGRLLITDLINNRFQICNEIGREFTIYSGKNFQEPWATAVTQTNNIAITSCKSKCVRIINPAGELIKTFGEYFFICPTGIAVDKQNKFVVCDSTANKVSIHEQNGDFIKYVENTDNKETFSKPRYVTVSITGDIIVSDSGNHKIQIFNSNGHFKKSFGEYGKGKNQLKCPYGVTTNELGDIFVADHYNNRITMYTRDGVFIRELVSAENGLIHPQGVILSDDLHLYVSHGYLKANEILKYKLNYSKDYSSNDFINLM